MFDRVLNTALDMISFLTQVGMKRRHPAGSATKQFYLLETFSLILISKKSQYLLWNTLEIFSKIQGCEEFLF